MLNKMLSLLTMVLLSTNIAFAQELKTITAEKFVAAKPSPERQAIADFITNQFKEPHEEVVTQAKLDELWNDVTAKKTGNFTRFQIVKQALYADSTDINDARFKTLARYLQTIIQQYKIKDVDFIVYTNDGLTPIDGWEEKIKNFPMFMMSKNLSSPYEKNKFLLPDEYMLGDVRKLYSKIENAIPEHNWDSKIDKVFWRGSSSGGIYNLSNFDKPTRLKLAIFSRLYPDLIDAQIVDRYNFSKDQDGDDLKKVMELLFGNDIKSVKEADHLKYKYLIAVDGNTCPWARVPWIMFSNSVLLKQETSNIEWFYAAMKPYVHYIPVDARLTDLFSRLAWMKHNDEAVEQISIKAHHFVQNNLMPEDIESHMAIILNSYHTIQKDERIIPSLPTIEDVYAKDEFVHATLSDKVKSRVLKLFR